MWTRAELKERAQKVLAKYYWAAFVVTFVASIFGGSQICGNPSFTYQFNAQNRWLPNDGYAGDNYLSWSNFDVSGSGMVGALVSVVLGALAITSAVLIVFLFSYGLRIFVGGPMETGVDRYFLEARQGRSDFANLLYSFKDGRYWSVLKATAWRELFTFLWTLLLIIPGVIKSYAYSMVPFLLADNPALDYRRAMKLSIAMTDGEKWNIFVLQLSFLGWILLGLLACCIGVIFVVPYQSATLTELYVVLRQQAIDNGLCTADEVGQNTLAAAQ
jgi:uncharacterized membrane protein